MWRLTLCFVLALPTLSVAQSTTDRATIPPPASRQGLSGPIITIPWGEGVTSYWDTNGHETRVYQPSPGMSYYIGPNGERGFAYDNFSDPKPLSDPTTSKPEDLLRR